MTTGPIVANPIPDQASLRHAYWQFTFASNTFSDVDSPSLNYAATQGDGNPLPYWLTFNAATRTFSGTPPRDGAFNFAFQIKVIASDGSESVSDTFTFKALGNIILDGPVRPSVTLTNASDIYTASNVGEQIIGGGGNDVITGGLGNDVINGGAGDDKIDGGGGQDILHGDEGNDYLTSSPGILNIAYGDGGDDQLFFVGNQNQLFGGDAKPGDNDWLGVSGNNNALAGGFGNDWLGATGNGNTLAGEAGSDSLFAIGGANALFGGIDNDWLGVSGSGNRLDGGSGGDWLGATGNNNMLDGGAGNDTLVAAPGAHQGDTFVFHAGYGIDEIQGFARHGGGGSDVIDLKGFGFGSFAAVQALMVDQGGNAVLTINAATVLTIDGVLKAQLQASDFLLA